MIVNVQDVVPAPTVFPDGEYHMEIVQDEDVLGQSFGDSCKLHFLCHDGERKGQVAAVMLMLNYPKKPDAKHDVAEIAKSTLRKIVDACGFPPTTNLKTFNTNKLVGKFLTVKLKENGEYQNLVSARPYAGPAIGKKAAPAPPIDSDPFED